MTITYENTESGEGDGFTFGATRKVVGKLSDNDVVTVEGAFRYAALGDDMLAAAR